MNRLQAESILKQIADLKVLYPEIWDDGDEQLLADSLEGSTGVNEFLADLVDRMQEAKAIAHGLDDRIDNLSVRLSRYQRKASALRDLAFKVLSAADLRKIELEEATLSLTRTPDKIIITDETALPDEACRTHRSPDKTKIRELLKAGPVAGAELSNGGLTLSVRTK